MIADTIAEKMKLSGLWAMMRQRPYDTVPDPAAEPRDIFVTAFDSAPLAGKVVPSHLEQYLETASQC